jgi:hypothetical protein
MHDSEPVAFVIDVFAFEHSARFPGVFSFPVTHAVQIHSFVGISIFENILAEAGALAEVISFAFVCPDVQRIFLFVEFTHVELTLFIR